MTNDSTPTAGRARPRDADRVLAASHEIAGWGRFVFAWNDAGLMLLGLPDRAPGENLGRLAGRGVIVNSTDEVPAKFREALTAYFDGEPGPIAQLDAHQPGTEFQRAVWGALIEIPLGETRTYGAIAKRVGRSAAVRAIGNACNANWLGIVVPCHRVVGHAGPGGYAAGIAWKQRLLAHELRIASRRE